MIPKDYAEVFAPGLHHQQMHPSPVAVPKGPCSYVESFRVSGLRFSVYVRWNPSLQKCAKMIVVSIS